jgi:arsenate reductase (thioredoxin)
MKTTRVLFLCTGNSARSILCAATLNHLGEDRFTAYSAGSQPAGVVNPNALRELAKNGIATEGSRSKSWDEFTSSDSPVMDIVITVCDSAAAETCPVFFGDFIRVHWGLPDPTFVTGDDSVVAEAFHRTQAVITQRMQALVALPVESLSPERLLSELNAINERYPAVELAGTAA